MNNLNTESKLTAVRSEGLRKVGMYIMLGILGMIFLFVMVGSASSKANTLQDSVVMAQADYELSQSQTLAGMQQLCMNWQELALAKVELAKATNLQSGLEEAAVKAVDCKLVTVPSSF
jgi:hypothetical protein